MSKLLEREEYSKRFTEYYRGLQERYGDRQLKRFAGFRDFKEETVKNCDIVYIESMTEMLLPDFIEEINSFGVISPTNNKPIFNKRWVIPIKDSDGNVLNLVGYSPDADERYIYGLGKYYLRKDNLWGLENINSAYLEGYAIVTEGITDAIRIRDLGFKNAFARCGTGESEIKDKVLNRCRYGIIKFPDRDSAGRKAVKSWNSYRSITLFPNGQYKDIDEMCRDSAENKEIVTEYINEAIRWLKEKEHKGFYCENEHVTIL